MYESTEAGDDGGKKKPQGELILCIRERFIYILYRRIYPYSMWFDP